MADETLQDLAFSNALSSLIGEKRLPENVFAGQWDDYLFFESDLLFEEGFVDAANVLLRDEHASVIALINLGIAEVPDAFFLDRGTKWVDYHSKLIGDGTPINWVFLRDHYVCASDRGRWIIYCERENDIAVFAFHELPAPTVAKIRQLFQATSINYPNTLVSAEGFDFGKLVPNWRNTLKVEYASRPA